MKNGTAKDRKIFIDDNGCLTVSFDKKKFTKRRATNIFQISPPTGFWYVYQDDVDWVSAHSKTDWVWFQPKKEI